MKFRDLKADEIICRVVGIGEGFVKLLLCRDPRTDMSILTEGVGNAGWQCEMCRQEGTLFCKVGVNLYYDKAQRNPCFVWKSDVGEKRYDGDSKGEASEAFQRACVKWGIGAELYTAPKIIVRGVNTIRKNGKLVTDDHFRVSEISVADKRVTSLSIDRFYRDDAGAWQRQADAFIWRKDNAFGEDSGL